MTTSASERGPIGRVGRRVAVLGGGLAGLAAAVAAIECGLEVELFEARPRLGGRAGSFLDPKTGQLVDRCQHVAMGCCTNWADLCRRTGIDDCFEHHRRLWFVGPDARAYSFHAAPLPAPFHLFPSVVRLGYLSLRERLGIVRAIVPLVRGEGDGTAGPWLRRHGQSERAIARFWSTVLVSALSEAPDRASLAAARKVFRDGFFAHRRAWELVLPREPLGAIYDGRLGRWLESHGATVRRAARVKTLQADGHRASAVVLADGSRRAFDFFVVAVPWRRVRSLFPEDVLRAMPELRRAEAIPSAPITAVHLWFDRPLMSLPHAAPIGRLGQWVFNHGQPHEIPCRSYYCQVVISASHEVRLRPRGQVLAEVRGELETIWPAARAARLLHGRVVTEPAAVFSLQPGVEPCRPSQTTSLANVMLAGDWTATGWPATMESAVRSGYLAVEGILRSLGKGRALLVPDLAPSPLARWILQSS